MFDSCSNNITQNNSYLVKSLAVIDTDDGSNHLGDNDHVSQMCLHNFGLLIWWGLLLCATQFLHQGHWLALQATGESPASAGVHELHELLTESYILRLC